MPSSITYNDVDLGGSIYNLTVMRSPRQAMPQLRLHTFQHGGADGALTQGTDFNARSFLLNCHVSGSSPSDLRDKLDNIKGVIDPRNGPKFLIIQDFWALGGNDRGAYAVIDSALNITFAGMIAVTFPLNVFIPSGVLLSAVDTAQHIDIVATPTTFNVPASGTVSGNSTALPVWFITNTNASAVTTLTLLNNTTSQSITWATSFAQNNKLRIDAERKHVEVLDASDAFTALTAATNASPVVITAAGHGLSTGDFLTVTGVGGTTSANSDWFIKVLSVNTFSLVGSIGNGAYTAGGEWKKWTNAMSSKTAGDPFPTLKPGVQNSVTLTGLTTGHVDITYRGRWI